MVTVFAAFALAEVITIKSIGVGMAIAVAVDATIIRVLLVPATMRLMGDWNWWAPGPFGRLADRLGFSHVEDEDEDVPPCGHAGWRDGARGVRWHLMDESPDSNVTRLPPNSGGRDPGAGSSNSKVYTWEWGPDQARRPGLPWIGIFLLVFGGLLLLRQLFPEARSLGSLITLAVGIAFLIKWADRPRHGLALCRGADHRPGRARRAERRRCRRGRPRHVLLRGRVPVHRRGPRRVGRRVRLAGAGSAACSCCWAA